MPESPYLQIELPTLSPTSGGRIGFNEIEAGGDESKREHVITERVRHSVAEAQHLSHRDTPDGGTDEYMRVR
jgi:hypothetical protein